ncbi:protein translocase subunit SecF [Synechococcales cyanobacterium C]|uniref:Protein-export membrane protein SecF n=1 Tax=Petrachloros mirabilis ULC683 TaxID=2781853 RepID=A0A8K2A266_9CYAN|nr:protein translocase subunit SecF [Petrachloros mirabilis]NCJ08491.1 protein translocase subunit SecF [Petrachloros mirabilis ULC683]
MKIVVSKIRTWTWATSGLLIAVGVLAMAISWMQFGAPLKPGLDFAGGTRLQFERDCTQAQVCDTPIDLAVVRQVLTEQGLGSSSIQILGAEQQGLSIRSVPLEPEIRNRLQSNLESELGAFDPAQTQIDTVGPTLGRQLLIAGMLALLVSFLGIIIYLSVRFQTDYAVLAIVALLHDVLVTAGVFALLGLVQGVEIDSLFVVALLTIVGFSVNDTVVIYDRVRENLKTHGDAGISEVVDIAVNQTLGRSINTTLTTILPLLAIFVLGGETLKYFALALIIGFVAGAYSSIFVASTLLAWWRERQMPALKTAVSYGEDSDLLE